MMARVVRASLRNFSTSVFHDSQAGLTLTRVDPRSLRLHELSSLNISSPHLQLLARVRPSSCEIDPARAAGPIKNVSVAAQLQRTIALRAAGCDEGIVTVDPSAEGVRTSSAAIKSLTDAKLRARVEISNAWSLDSNSLEDVVARLADAGAHSITLIDDDAEGADEDSIREAVERAFNLDVAGDPLMERLGVRSRHKHSIEAALDAGITRCDGDARGHLALSTRVILSLAAERKRNHSVDVARLDEFVALLS
jgi:hypothetical protein